MDKVLLVTCDSKFVQNVSGSPAELPHQPGPESCEDTGVAADLN